MLFSSGFVMSQNKMATLVWGLCTGNYWKRYWFIMIAFIKSKEGQGHWQGIYYFLLLLSTMSKTLRTTLYLNNTCWSLFCPHTSAPVLLIVTSFQISFIRKKEQCQAGYLSVTDVLPIHSCEYNLWLYHNYVASL